MLWTFGKASCLPNNLVRFVADCTLMSWWQCQSLKRTCSVTFVEKYVLLEWIIRAQYNKKHSNTYLLFSYLCISLYCPNSIKRQISWLVHPNRNWNWVSPFDSNNEYHTHPNNIIIIGGHFLSILVLVFYSNSIPRFNSMHPNTA
jgi:hypothetical protein